MPRAFPKAVFASVGSYPHVYYMRLSFAFKNSPSPFKPAALGTPPPGRPWGCNPWPPLTLRAQALLLGCEALQGRTRVRPGTSVKEALTRIVRGSECLLRSGPRCCACLILVPNHDPSAPARVPTGLQTTPNGPDHILLAVSLRLTRCAQPSWRGRESVQLPPRLSQAQPWAAGSQQRGQHRK